MGKGHRDVFYGSGSRVSSLSQPLLFQGSPQFSEIESGEVRNSNGESYEDTNCEEVSYSKDEDGGSSRSEITSDIVDRRMTVSASDESSAPYETNPLTFSYDNLPVSFPVCVENAFNNEDFHGQLRQDASIGQPINTNTSLKNEIISQAGDGDRDVSRRGSHRGSGQVYADEGAVHPITVSRVIPLSSGIMNVVPNDADLYTEQEEKKELPPLFAYIAYLIHLAVFGILGNLTRYLLQKLFGPSGAGVTSDGSILYRDLPSNMAGSFLMGWLGVVFKSNISSVSDQLAIGLSTGYLGSLTTFSGWNQKMLDLSVDGHWLFAVLGFITGLILAAGSISFGIETAEGFKWLLRRIRIRSSISKWRVNRHKCNLIILLVLVLIWAGFWTTSGILEEKEFKDGGSGAQLWLACFVGPIGVWIRWWLARLNGRGFGREGLCSWIPYGTLIANVSAACVMAALAIVKKVVNTTECDTIATGLQFGLMGCLSTVSTLMAEFNALRKSSYPWRAYVYVALTVGVSFSLGTLMYSVPVWIKGYK